MSGDLIGVEVGALRVAYLQAWHGPPLVLLHGGLADSREWRRQLDGLADEFTVVAWDAPGCGGSSDPPGTFRLPDYADCLAGFIQALELGRPHVGGLSWGGGLALELYRRHPQVPRSLVLASAYAGWAGSLPPEVIAERLDRALREADLPPEQWVPGWLPGLFTNSAPAELVEEALAMMLDVRPAGMRPMLQGFAEADLRDVLPRIQVPTLLLETVARDLHASIPGSRLVVLPGVGHQSDMEAPARFNAEVRGFLRSVQQ